MAELASTHEIERPAEEWKCTACAEIWEIVQRDGVAQGCPECRGPLRLISSLPSHRVDPVTRERVALSHDQQWLVVHRLHAPTSWTILQRVDEIDGFAATGTSYEDIGQSATDVLAAFLATSRARKSFHLEHTAAD